MGPSGRITHVFEYIGYIEYIGLLGTGFMQVFYLGRAPRTKETLPDFLKWSRVTRHPLVFRGLTGSQRTPGDRGVTNLAIHRISSNSEIVRICTFFEASSIRCRKTKSEVTKVTYNMYACDTCYMIREMMEMEGRDRDSAKCQKSKRKNMIDIIEFD